MSGRSKYLHYFLKNTPSSLIEKLFHKQRSTDTFLREKDISIDFSGRVIADYLREGRPFAAVRFGASELSCLNAHEKIQLGFAKTYKDSVRWAMKVRAGFYPTDDKHLNEYCDYFASKIGMADLLAISGLHMEDYFFLKYTPQAKVITNWALEPLLGGWTPLLKGKKVLVVSAFPEEITFQYARREKIFPKEPDLLPEFLSLSVIQAPMTMGDGTDYRFPSFMRSLDEIKNAIKLADFDVALIGCGAYGTLLTLFCKSLGKMALQTGGATQTLFGIMGKRWENRPHVSSRVNAYWIRPEKKPKGFEKIDQGAYW